MQNLEIVKQLEHKAFYNPKDSPSRMENGVHKPSGRPNYSLKVKTDHQFYELLQFWKQRNIAPTTYIDILAKNWFGVKCSLEFARECNIHITTLHSQQKVSKLFWPMRTLLTLVYWGSYSNKQNTNKRICNNRPWTALPVPIWVRWQLHNCNDSKLINTFIDWNLSKCSKQYLISLWIIQKTTFFRHIFLLKNSA